MKGEKEKMTQVTDEIRKHARNPQGEAGKIMIQAMNIGHKELTEWAFHFLAFQSTEMILDIGCGGGVAVKMLSQHTPEGRVYGIDYSKTAIECAENENCKKISEGKVVISRESVEKLSFADESFDKVFSIESYYFWPNLAENMKEVYRVIKPGGKFILVAEMVKIRPINPVKEKIIKELDMTWLSPEEIRSLFHHTGYQKIDLYYDGQNGWLCVVGEK